jgi:hormone-sensitive lipase
VELASLISSKIQKNDGNQSQSILTVDDFFPQEKNDKNNEIMDIIQNQYKNIDKDYAIIKGEIAELLNNMKIINETKEECGIPLMCYLLYFYIYFLKKVKNQLDLFKSIENLNDNKDIKVYRKNMIIFFDLIFILQKLEIGFTILYNGYRMDENDIFNFEENSENWRNLKKVMMRVNSKDLQKLREEYNTRKEKTFDFAVYINKMDSESNFFFNLTKAAGSAIKYKVNSDENLKIFESKENKLLSKKVFLEESLKILKNKMVKTVMKKRFPKIALREKVYMKREQPEITLEYIKSLLMKIYDKDTILKNFEGIQQPEREPLDEEIKNKMPIWAEKLKKEEKNYYVSTRLFSSIELNLNKKVTEQKSNFNLFGLFNKKKNVTEKKVNEIQPKELLIHVHGGGFLESSTLISENFLREASNECGIPIIGINYGCAPKHKYPEAINDCFQAYMWILVHCEEELGFKPEKIMLSGDSAGGSLILGLTLLIIAMNEFDGKKIKRPDLIIGLYPCCSLDKNAISLSGCTVSNDLILSPRDTKYMRDAYRGYYKNELDPFLNQNKADENLLKHFPTTRFLTATFDGLRDEAVRFINKLSNINGIDVKLYDFTYYEHGFMGNLSQNFLDIPHSIFFNEIKQFINK